MAGVFAAAAFVLGAMLSAGHRAFDFTNEIFGSFVAVSGDAHQAKVAQDIFRQEIRYERSLQIREDIRDVNKMMLESVQTHLFMGSIILGVCFSMFIEGYPPEEADRLSRNLWLVFTGWSVTFTLISLWLALCFQARISSCARERLLRKHRFQMPDDQVVGKMGGGSLINQIANFHDRVLQLVSGAMNSKPLKKRGEEPVVRKVRIRQSTLRVQVDSPEGKFLDAAPMQKGMHAWLSRRKHTLEKYTILDMPTYLEGETLIRSHWLCFCEAPLVMRVNGEATLYIAAQVPPREPNAQATLSTALRLNGQQLEWPDDELPYVSEGYHHGWCGPSGYGEFKRVNGFSIFIEPSNIELPIYKIVLQSPEDEGDGMVVVQVDWRFKKACEGLLIVLRRGQIHCKEEDWPIAEFNEEIKQVMPLRDYSGLYMRYGVACLIWGLLFTCYSRLMAQDTIAMPWLEVVLLVTALTPALLALCVVPIAQTGAAITSSISGISGPERKEGKVLTRSKALLRSPRAERAQRSPRSPRSPRSSPSPRSVRFSNSQPGQNAGANEDASAGSAGEESDGEPVNSPQPEFSPPLGTSAWADTQPALTGPPTPASSSTAPPPQSSAQGNGASSQRSSRRISGSQSNGSPRGAHRGLQEVRRGQDGAGNRDHSFRRGQEGGSCEPSFRRGHGHDGGSREPSFRRGQDGGGREYSFRRGQHAEAPPPDEGPSVAQAALDRLGEAGRVLGEAAACALPAAEGLVTRLPELGNACRTLEVSQCREVLRHGSPPHHVSTLATFGGREDLRDSYSTVDCSLAPPSQSDCELINPQVSGSGMLEDEHVVQQQETGKGKASKVETDHLGSAFDRLVDRLPDVVKPIDPDKPLTVEGSMAKSLRSTVRKFRIWTNTLRIFFGFSILAAFSSPWVELLEEVLLFRQAADPALGAAVPAVLPWVQWEVAWPPFFRPTAAALGPGTPAGELLWLAADGILRALVVGDGFRSPPLLLPAAARGLSVGQKLAVIAEEGVFEVDPSSLPESPLTTSRAPAGPLNATTVAQADLLYHLPEGITGVSAAALLPNHGAVAVAATDSSGSSSIHLCGAAEEGHLRALARLGLLVAGGGNVRALYACAAGTCAEEPVLWVQTRDAGLLAVGLSSGTVLGAFGAPTLAAPTSAPKLLRGGVRSTSVAASSVAALTGNASHLVAVVTSEAQRPAVLSTPLPVLPTTGSPLAEL